MNQSTVIGFKTRFGLTAIALVFASHGAVAAETSQPAARAYSIPAGTLSEALTEFADQANLKLVFNADLTRGFKAPALRETVTVAQGLNKLLKDSGLSYRVAGNNTTIIEPKPVVEKTQPRSAPALPVVKVTGEAVQDPNDPYNKSYTVTNSSTATKTDTPIMDTPVSIQVVPRAVMNDQKTTTIKDALENVSSVRPQSSLGASNGFIIRGFSNNKIYRNGLVANGISIGSRTQFESANLERVEVLKGPAAVLFGRIEPGGLINLVTKKPRDEAYYSLEQRFGSYDFYRTEWDATGAITEDRSLSYRFAGSYQNNKSFRDFNFNDRVLMNPSLTWRLGDSTELSLEVEVLDEDYQVDRGLFAIGNRPAPIPISRSFIDPNDPVDTLSKVNLGFNLTHAFNEDWTLRNRFLATFVDSNDISVKPANAFTVAQFFFLNPSAGNRTYLRNIFSQISDSDTYTTNLDLTGKFDLWGISHQTLIGIDFLRSTGINFTRGNFLVPMQGLEIDIFNPVYGIDPSFYAKALATPFPAGDNHS